MKEGFTGKIFGMQDGGECGWDADLSQAVRPTSNEIALDFDYQGARYSGRLRRLDSTRPFSGTFRAQAGSDE